MSTAWCFSVAFLVPWVVGVPVAWFTRGCRSLRPRDWPWVPFLGLAAIICPLQTLSVFADLPLSRTVTWFWGATGAAWAALLVSRNGRRSLRTVPWRLLALTLAVYTGQGAGVLVRGIEGYRGNLKSDQYHYVVLAQFLMEEPFSIECSDLGDRPWLIMPLILKADRLGQSVAHGFIAITAGRDALDTFFPALLLGPGLMVPAVFLLGGQCGLSRRWTVWAALAAALAPGVEIPVSYCYLSQALGDSALIAFMAGVIRLARGGDWRALPGTMGTLVLGFSVYTEFVPLFAGTAGAALVLGVLRRHVRPLRAAGVAAALVLSLGLNPAAASGARTVWKRGTTAGVQMNTGHRTALWVSAVWVHFDKAGSMARRTVTTYSHAFVYGSEVAALFGGLALVNRALRSRRRLLPSLASVSLLVPPALLWLGRPEAAYAVGKLILTLTPVLILFIACGADALERRWPTRRGRRVVRALGTGLLAVLIAQSGMEQWTWLRGGRDVGPARAWNEPDLQQLCRVLSEHAPSDVVIVLPGDGGDTEPAVESGALCYFGRHHRIRLVPPLRIWMVDLPDLKGYPHTTLEGLRAGSFVVTRRSGPALRVQAQDVLFENQSYRLVRIDRVE
ncbi:hypothetical protein [Frigoriglobus tundricola]|uniref:Glycosyltransferase RgtA/B/C/D-like domain-containing protein n=1 Tax=Frigoriglobus tundricola TaxID=2774151 RepID=A0A6M5Z4C3_9BACT|nr:hypothetical protein [Frigoriglobus tundricola]QJX00565.1 hypothetical protein FTUN_8195 [Frigoriglobus tundricola]